MNGNEKKEDQGREPRIGVYICHCGGNISDHVDVERVEALAKDLPGVAVARRNSFMCSDPGQEMILEDIKSGRVDRIVVASCAPSLHETTFRGVMARAGLNPYLYDHANIREQVSWVHHGNGATAKAAGLVAASVAKTRHLTALEPIRVDAWHHATIVGGGVAGLKAAQDLADLGIDVTIVEKSPYLGGRVAELTRLFPTGEKASDLLVALASAVLENPRIQVLTEAEIQTVEGYVGNFKLNVRQGHNGCHGLPPAVEKDIDTGPGFTPFQGLKPDRAPEGPAEVDLRTGALLVATGFKPYQPLQGEYGYGDNPEVMTLPDFIRLMEESPDGADLIVNGRPVRSAAFIHCVGSRHIPGVNEPGGEGRLNEYCSRVCCTATLQAALELRKKSPQTTVYDLYRDIRAYGRGHEEFYLDASRNRVVFVRFTPENQPLVEKDPGGEYPLKITVADTLLGNEELEIPVDLVVLAVGMEAGDTASLVEMMKLPVGADGFLLEVHPKLRPVEVSVSGVVLAGTAQAPMDVTEASATASAAAAKVSSLLSKGFVELDPFVAEVDALRCTGCGDCLDICLREGALVMSPAEAGPVRAEVVPALCQGCGVCAAVCREDAIRVNGWTLRQYEAMVDAIVGTADQSAIGG